MDLNKLYTTIFPIGGIDDNNRYASLTGDKINSVQLLEPALCVSEFVLTKKDSYDKNNVMDKISNIYCYSTSMNNGTIFDLEISGQKDTKSGD